MFAMVVTYAMVGYIQRIPGRAQLAAMPSTQSAQVEVAPKAGEPASVEAVLEAQKNASLFRVLAVLSALMVLAGVAISKYLCSPFRLSLRAQRALAASEKNLDLQKQDEVLELVARVSLLHFAASWALVVGAALNGFALSQTLKDPNIYLPFALVSLVFLVLLRPQVAVLEKVARQLSGNI